MNPHEDVKFLVASEHRVTLLQTLKKCSAPPGTLADRCSVSRPAIWRSLNGFVERNWVRKVSGQYQITIIGEYILDGYERLIASIDSVNKGEVFLEQLGALNETFPVAALNGTTVVNATPEDPYVPVTRFEEALTAPSADRFHAIMPTVSPVAMIVFRQLSIQDADLELIVDEAVLNAVRLDGIIDDLHSHRHLQLCVLPEKIEFGLLISTKRALVGAYDSWGNLRAVLDGTNDALLDWTTDIYESHRREAIPIDAVPATMT